MRNRKTAASSAPAEVLPLAAWGGRVNGLRRAGGTVPTSGGKGRQRWMELPMGRGQRPEGKLDR